MYWRLTWRIRPSQDAWASRAERTDAQPSGTIEITNSGSRTGCSTPSTPPAAAITPSTAAGKSARRCQSANRSTSSLGHSRMPCAAIAWPPVQRSGVAKILNSMVLALVSV